MQFSTLFTSAFLAATALAAPTPAGAVSAAADVPQWTIEGLVRTCDAGDTSCTWSFTIDTHTGPTTPCSYSVSGAPASQASVNGVTCGAFGVSSNWSGQFGPGNGFTAAAVVDYAAGLIAFPAYQDTALQNGVVVSPDRSFNVQNV